MADSKDNLTEKAHYDPTWIAWNGGYLHSNNGMPEESSRRRQLIMGSIVLFCNVPILRPSLWQSVSADPMGWDSKSK